MYLLSIGILALNVWQFHIVTPESIAVKAWYSLECDRNPEVMFVGNHLGLMDLVARTYLPPKTFPYLVRYDADDALLPWHTCKILVRPYTDPAFEVLTLLESDRTMTVTDGQSTSRVVVVLP